MYCGTAFKDTVPFSSTEEPLKGTEVAVLTQCLCSGLLYAVYTVHGFSAHLLGRIQTWETGHSFLEVEGLEHLPQDRSAS